jgi:hypothetical protein
MANREKLADFVAWSQKHITGDVLGWSWLFPPYFWRFDARTLDPTEAIFFYAAPLRNECEIDHDLGYELTRRIACVAVRRLQATRWKLLDKPV